MKRTILLALTMIFLGGIPLYAQGDDTGLIFDPSVPTTRVGTRGAAFLALGVGPRAQALGGAYAAMAEGVSALYWNTAGIGELDGFTTGISQAKLYGDLGVDHTFFGAVLPFGLNRVGISVNLLTSGEMNWTSASFPDNGFGGESNPARSVFEWTALAIGGHYARPVTDRLSAGGAVKVIQEGITGAQASYVAFDLGVLFDTGLYGITLGAALQNVGSSGRMSGKELTSKINTQNSESQGVVGANRVLELESVGNTLRLPTTFRFSIMTDLIGGPSSIIAPNPDQSLRLLASLNDGIDSSLQSAIGLEYGFREIAFLRVGKRWMNPQRITYDFLRNASVGGGVRVDVPNVGAVRLDYSFTDMGSLDNVQMLGVEVQF